MPRTPPSPISTSPFFLGCKKPMKSLSMNEINIYDVMSVIRNIVISDKVSFVIYLSATGLNKTKQFLSIKNISIHLIKLKKLFNNPFLIPKKIDIMHMIRKVISKALRN